MTGGAGAPTRSTRIQNCAHYYAAGEPLWTANETLRRFGACRSATRSRARWFPCRPPSAAAYDRWRRGAGSNRDCADQRRRSRIGPGSVARMENTHRSQTRCHATGSASAQRCFHADARARSRRRTWPNRKRRSAQEDEIPQTEYLSRLFGGARNAVPLIDIGFRELPARLIDRNGFAAALGG